MLFLSEGKSPSFLLWNEISFHFIGLEEKQQNKTAVALTPQWGGWLLFFCVC